MPKAKDLDIVKPWKKHTICQLEATWRTPGSLVRPHLWWRILSIIYHLEEGGLQLIQSVTPIGHHHVPHSVLNTFPDQFPLHLYQLPGFLSESSQPHLIPKTSFKWVSVAPHLIQAKRDVISITFVPSPTNVLQDISSCLPPPGRLWRRTLIFRAPCSYFRIASLSIAGSSPPWSQAELQALHTPHWSSVFAALSWCNLQPNLLLSLSKLLSTFLDFHVPFLGWISVFSLMSP